MKISREQFQQSNFMKIELVSVEKRVLHHNRFVIQVTLDKFNFKAKKKYSQLKRFSQQIETKLAIKEVTLQKNLRSANQYKNIEDLIKKLNSGFLLNKIDSTKEEIAKKQNLRNYLYNMLFYNDEMECSDQENQQEKQYRYSNQNLTLLQQSNEQKVQKSLSPASLANSLVATLKKNGPSPMKELFKTIKIIWIKVQNQWQQCLLTISQSTLILHNRQLNIKRVLILCKLGVQLQQLPYRSIKIFHKLLLIPIQIRLHKIDEQKNQMDTYEKYLALYTNLKEISNKFKMIDIVNFVKIKLTSKITQKLGINPLVQSDKKKQKQLAIKVIHNSIISVFTFYVEATNYIFLPLIQNYGVVQMFLTQVKEPGVIPTFKQNLQNFSIPIQNIYDLIYNQKPKRKTQVRTFTFQGKQNNYIINFGYKELANRLSFFAYDEVKDKFEGTQESQEANKQAIRIHTNRFKRILWTIQEYSSVLTDLKQFQNPILSYAYYIFLLFCIIFFNGGYLIHYFVFIAICLMIYNHPLFQSYVRQIVNWASAQELYKNIITILQTRQDTLKYPVQLKFDLQKKRFLQNFQLTMKKKRNIYKKYKRLQQYIYKAQYTLMQLVNFIEKVKNLFTWYHYKKSHVFFCLMLLALVVTIFIPIKVILIYMLYKMFKSGKKFSEKTTRHNQTVLKEVFLLCIKQNNINEIKSYVIQTDKLIDKKQSDYVYFEKKVKEYLQNILEIQYDPQIFVKSRSIRDLLNSLSQCKKRFIIPLQICKKYELNQDWAWRDSAMTKILKICYGFISNIPSDKSIMGVKVDLDNTQMLDIQQKMDEQDQEDQKLFSNLKF